MIPTFFIVLGWVLGSVSLLLLFLLAFGSWVDPIPNTPGKGARWAVRLGATLLFILAMTGAITFMLEMESVRA